MTGDVSTVPDVGGKRVLITGGLGFIGAALTRRLIAAGNAVTIVDSAPLATVSSVARSVHRHPDVTVVHGDVTDPRTFDRLDDGFDHVVHAAAVLGVERVMTASVRTLDVNVRGTQLCLDFASRQRALQRLLLLSTSEVYGRHALNARETDPIRLDTDSVRWCYAASKAAAEFMAIAYRAERGVPVSVVRPFNVYGPHRSWTNAMTIFVGRALRGQDIEVTGTGAQRRSWCHIDDFVDGALRCLFDGSAVGEIFNIGNATASLTVLQLARRVVELTASTSTIRLVHTGTPDVFEREPSLEKARRVLGYRPSIGIDDGIVSVAGSMSTAPVGTTGRGGTP